MIKELKIKIKSSTEHIQELEDQKQKFQFLLLLASGSSLVHYSLKVTQINRQLTIEQEALQQLIQHHKNLTIELTR